MLVEKHALYSPDCWDPVVLGWMCWQRQQATFLPWTVQLLDREGKLSASRIDLILANHAAMALVQRAEVISSVRDGGHSPVVVALSFSGKVSMCWKSPRPKPPALMFLSSAELSRSNDWAKVMQDWLASS